MRDVPHPLGDFAQRLIAWQVSAGRHHLPWQGTRDPYRVWLSEIMLQQTQVSTVLGYFDRFLARFPNVQALAGAAEGDVLALWSGLGYYSRARNLHRCAQVVVQEHGGCFPSSAHELTQLPGIGPSTAAAIASFCFGQRVSIFDGNVKRVMARHLGFEQDLSSTAADRALKAQVDQRVPSSGHEHLMPAYTQGLMDLGATVCTPRRPRCSECPLAADCKARAQGRVDVLPVKTRKLVRRTQLWWWLVLWRDDGRVWLARRPSRGVWGGLHSFPSFDAEASLEAALPADWRSSLTAWPAFTHVLTHMDLVLHARVLRLSAHAIGEQATWLNALPGEWHSCPNDTRALGLPAPVSKVLGQLLTL
ncbi:A/G-specific adenine glycosylase [Hydrogenophaga soli]